jgi:ATP-dependent RNA helicase DeaD
MKAPAVSSVTKALENRILNAILETAPEPELDAEIPADSNTTNSDSINESSDTAQAAAVAAQAAKTPALPQTRLGRKLVKKLGAETAVEALIIKAFGDKLDPSRYGTITELNEVPQRELDVKQRLGKGKLRTRGPGPAARGSPKNPGVLSGARVYVGLGRRHGASARDVAGLLIRAGGVPVRLVNSIEMKDYCAYATLPEDAARRACTFSRNTPDDPAIKPASPGNYNEGFQNSPGAARHRLW